MALSQYGHGMPLDLHSGKINEAELSPKLGRRYISEHHKGYDNRYNTLSLDQPIPEKMAENWAT
jgi:hypothetical protein